MKAYFCLISRLTAFPSFVVKVSHSKLVYVNSEVFPKAIDEPKDDGFYQKQNMYIYDGMLR